MKDLARLSAISPIPEIVLCSALAALATCGAGRAQQPDAAAADVAADVFVHGRAVAGDGSPMAGCCVGLFARGAGVDVDALRASPGAVTDADGRYRLEVVDLEPHRWVVATFHEGMQVCVQRLHPDAAGARGMPPALMLPGGTLSGRVRDADGRALAGATVKVTDPAVEGRVVQTWFESLATSDERGIFHVRGVPRTGLTVTVQAPGYAPQQSFAAHDSPLDVRLQPTGMVRGGVVDANGEPVSDAFVRCVTVGRQFGSAHGTSGADGSFAVTAPAAWRFRIAASLTAPPYTQYSSGLLQGPADDVVVRARAIAGRDVTVRCVAAGTQQPIANFEAWHSTLDAPTPAIVLLHPPHPVPRHEGEAVLHVRRDPGNRTLGCVVARAPGHGFAIVPVPEQSDGPLVIELPAECVLTGTVTDAGTGRPLAGAAVVAMPFANLGGSCDPSQVGPEQAVTFTVPPPALDGADFPSAR